MQQKGLRKAAWCAGRCMWQRPSAWSRDVLRVWGMAIEPGRDPDTKETLYYVNQAHFESAMRTCLVPQEEWLEARTLFDWLCSTLNTPLDADDPDPESDEYQ